MPSPLMIHPAECAARGRQAQLSGQPVEHRARCIKAAGPVAADFGSRREGEAFWRAGNTAVVMVDGPIWYDASGYGWWGGMDLLSLASTFRDLANDESIEVVAIDIDSPGGSVAGISDLIDALDTLAASKTVYAFGHEMICSLAYWMATRCQAIYATPSSMSGSIGAISVWYDTSEMAKRLGEEAKVFTSSAPHKALGVYGVEITDEMAQSESEMVTAMGRDFRASVTERRGISEEAILEMGGAAYYAEAQLQHNLVDELMTTHEFYTRLMAGDLDTNRGDQDAAPTPHSPTAHGAGGERTAIMDDTLKETIEAMTDEEKQELIALAQGDDEDNSDQSATDPGEDEDQTPISSTQDEDEDQPSAMTIPQIKAFLADSGITDAATVNQLAVAAIEKGWSETQLLQQAIKAGNASDPSIKDEAAGNPSAIGGNNPGRGKKKATYKSYDDAVKAYQSDGLSHAKAIQKANKEHPDLRAAKFGPAARN